VFQREGRPDHRTQLASGCCSKRLAGQLGELEVVS